MTLLVKSLCPTCGRTPPPNAVVCPHDGTEVVRAAVDPLVGTDVGTWRVLKRLGVGGMGAVYEAVETTIEKRVALKIVHPHLSDLPELPSLVAEAKAVNAIQDRGIVDIFGWGRLPDGRQYLVMELLEGEPLERLLARKGRLSLAEVLAIADPLLVTLGSAHRAGFVHRDIKTGNVFISSNQTPKLLDFGLAEQWRTQHGTMRLGTPDYVAPEQAAGAPTGPPADLYAFGCMLYELCSGKPPFQDPDTLVVLERQRSAPRPKLRDVVPEAPAALEALIVWLMQVDPTGRPASAELVREQLREALGANDPPPPAPRRFKAVYALPVIALAALGVFLFLRAPGPASPRTAAPDPARQAVLRALTAIGASLDAGQLLDSGGAVDQLLAAQAAFPRSSELEAVRVSTVYDLRIAARKAVDRHDLDRADNLLGAAERLAPSGDAGGGDVLLAQVRRTRFATNAGMVKVGEVWVDKYEYPNVLGQPPVSGVDWSEAVALCSKAGKHLCSENEWQQACAGPGGRAYPYGEKLDRSKCRAEKKGIDDPARTGDSRGCVSAEGVFDLSGNVAEWTSSPVKEGSPQRVIRGGSYRQSDAKLGCAARDYYLPGQGGAEHIGLRCCL